MFAHTRAYNFSEIPGANKYTLCRETFLWPSTYFYSYLTSFEKSVLCCRYNNVVFTLTNLVKALAGRFNTRTQLEEVQNFIDTHPNLGTATRAFQAAVETTRNNIRWMDKNYDVVKSWLAASNYLAWWTQRHLSNTRNKSDHDWVLSVELWCSKFLGNCYYVWNDHGCLGPSSLLQNLLSTLFRVSNGQAMLMKHEQWCSIEY